MRVLSLLPSATEIVCDLGGYELLVGRSEECDFPPEVRSLPAVMRVRHSGAAEPSGEIDAYVRTTQAAGESLYALDLERLRALAPDVILTQDLCRVCSVTEAEVRNACQEVGIDPKIVTLEPTRLGEVWESIEQVGQAIGLGPESAERATRLRRATIRADSSGTPVRTAIVEWLDPPILAGLWTRDMVEAAGGTPVGPPLGSHGQRTTWAEIGRLRPDLVVLSPCSFPVERTQRDLQDPSLNGAVRELSPRRGVWLADEAYFSRPGPRLAEGVALLRSLVSGEPPRVPLPVLSFPGASQRVSA
jgi:iron complex transport system substrate-binding protein